MRRVCARIDRGSKTGRWPTETNRCTVSGFEPWNFTAPDQQVGEQSAFDSDVLKLEAHPCDRDYQFYTDFVSCTPSEDYTVLFDADGTKQTDMYSNDNRSITYQDLALNLPLIHHPNEAVGPTFGFTGVQKTYNELNLGYYSTNPGIKACSQLKVCGLQSPFMVNNHEVEYRLVKYGTVSRQYELEDLLECGVFGFSVENNICQLDFAIVPLAWLALNEYKTFGISPGSN